MANSIPDRSKNRKIPMDNPGNCPACNSWDDDLSARGGICETCYQENKR
jgi:hypothetical protein